MTGWRRAAAPFAAGLAAAGVAFTVVAVATAGNGDDPPARATTTTTETRADAVARGRVVFVRMGCGGCHRLSAAGSKGPIGPDLDTALDHHTRGSLLAMITDPGVASVMPDDFETRMSAADLQALADFLLNSR